MVFLLEKIPSTHSHFEHFQNVITPSPFKRLFQKNSSPKKFLTFAPLITPSILFPTFFSLMQTYFFDIMLVQSYDGGWYIWD